MKLKLRNNYEVIMPNPGNLKGIGFESRPEDINKNGRPVGKRNGSTIVSEILELVAVMPDDAHKRLTQFFPEIEKKMSGEKMLLLVQLAQAITKNDTNAANFLMNRRYGQPKQDLEVDNKTSINISIT